MDGRIGGAMGEVRAVQMPVRTGGVVARGAGAVHSGPMLVESDFGAAL
jgi:hypothetical protein